MIGIDIYKVGDYKLLGYREAINNMYRFYREKEEKASKKPNRN